MCAQCAALCVPPQVRAGIPPGLEPHQLIDGSYITSNDAYAEGLSAGLVRKSIMGQFTRAHGTSGACIQQDDYEGLLTLYPLCTAGGVPPTPTCLIQPINLGLLIVLTALAAPAFLGLVAAFLMQRAVRARLKALADQTNGGLGTQATSLVVRAATAGGGGAGAAAGGGGGLAGALGGGGGGGGGGGLAGALKGGSGLALTATPAAVACTSSSSALGSSVSPAPATSCTTSRLLSLTQKPSAGNNQIAPAPTAEPTSALMQVAASDAAAGAIPTGAAAPVRMESPRL